MNIIGEYVLRDVGGRCVAVPVGKECRQFHGMIKLNDTAKLIWQSVASGAKEDETISELTEKYDVTPEHARESYHRTIEKMREIGVLEVNDEELEK